MLLFQKIQIIMLTLESFPSQRPEDLYTMNAYIFDIFIMHSIVLENTEEDGMYTTSCVLVEIGPLNSPDFKNFNLINTMLCDIPSTPVAQNWLADF
jgi:hypothetical protein